MKKIAVCLLIFQFCFPSLIFAQTNQNGKGIGNKSVTNLPSKDKRWALIIGVDNYEKDISPLYGTVNDARALKDVLINYAGFPESQIILMTTDSNDPDLKPTRNNILDQLEKLSRQIPENGLVLFSFSGHGVSIGDDAFLIPSDGRIYQNAGFMRDRSIDVMRVKQSIQATKVKQVIMFLDACRNDPIRGKGESANALTQAYSNGFSFDTKNQSIEAYATLYATSFGDRAFEFRDKKTNKYRGYFSYAIEEALKGAAANDNGEVTLGNLIKYIETTVRQRVSVEENQRQIPYPSTEGFGNNDLVLAITSKKSPPSVSNSNTGETAFWQAIEKSTDVSDFEDYLREYPNGTYTAIARLKIKKFKNSQDNSTNKITEPPLQNNSNTVQSPPKPTSSVIKTGQKVSIQAKNAKGETKEFTFYDGSYALVIAENTYTNGWGNLPGVKSDVLPVKQVLEKHNFIVETVENADSNQLNNRIKKFINDYGFEQNNRLLIYYAGHAYVQKLADGRDLGYIVPSDSPDPQKDEVGFKRKAISMDTIQNYALQIQAKHALFIFDTSFLPFSPISNQTTSASPQTKDIKSSAAGFIPSFVQEIITNPVRQFIFSASADQLVPDESIFRRVFVGGLDGVADLNKDGFITGTELAYHLNSEVTNFSARRQTPTYGKLFGSQLDKGDFVFLVQKLAIR